MKLKLKTKAILTGVVAVGVTWLVTGPETHTLMGAVIVVSFLAWCFSNSSAKSK